MKKVFLIGISVLLAGYVLFGYVFVQKEEPELKETTVNAGQELGKAMADMEQKALNEKKRIQADIEAKSLKKEDLTEQMKEAVQYLQTHLGSMQENDPYIQMIYQSAFLLSFSHVPDSSRTEIQRKIETHPVSVQAERAHTYLVDRVIEQKRQEEILKGLKGLEEEDLVEFTELIWKDTETFK